jgi:ABC-type uncharacterized transport system auxiliary subunit
MTAKPLLLLLTASLAMSACAVTRKPDEPKVLRLAPAFAASANLAAGTYAVAPVAAGGMAGERRYTYVDRAAPGELKQAATLFWDEPPPRIVERALVAGLRTRFASVTGPDAALPADRRVSVRLERFEEQTSGGLDAAAVVALDATVIAATDRKVVLTGRYCGTAPIGGASSGERVHAFETALQLAVDGLGKDLAAGTARSAGC